MYANLNVDFSPNLSAFPYISLETEQDLSLASHFTLSSLEPIKCTPFSRESAPKFGTLFVIRLNYLNVKGIITKLN